MNITTNGITQISQFGGVPFGNVSEIHGNLTTNAAGAAVNTDDASAVQIADVVCLCLIPAGFKIFDAVVTISDAFDASTTASIGFLYADGVDDSSSPQDAAFICAGLALSSTGVSRKTGVKAPQKLTKDAYLVLTLAGAAIGSVGVVDVNVIGRNTGGSGL